jgi:putative Mn2+ efflux pump MntP
MNIFSIFLIGIALSMDTFSLSLCYGVLELSKRKMITLAVIVGLFHFFMPILGMVFGDIIKSLIIIDMKIIVFAIFMILGVEIIMSSIKKEASIILLNMVGMVLFAFTVSIDSFSAGIGINFISDKHLLCSVIFSLTSLTFTYVGLAIGNFIGSKFKDVSKVIGGLILIAFALVYLFKY